MKILFSFFNKIKTLLFFSLIFLMALAIELSQHDLPSVRDTVLQKSFEKDLGKLSKIIDSHKNESALVLREYLSTLEEKYAKYPRLSLQLVDLYVQIGQPQAASNLLFKTLEHKDKFCELQWTFVLGFCLEHQKNLSSPFLTEKSEIVEQICLQAPPSVQAQFFD